MKKQSLLVFTVIGLVLSGTLSAKPMQPLPSGNLPLLNQMEQAAEQDLVVARYYRDRHPRRSYDRHSHRRHHRNNNALGAALVGALIGGVIVNEVARSNRTYYRNRDGYQAAKNRCADKYRSYDWNTDTYITYGGEERLCRYVLPWH